MQMLPPLYRRLIVHEDARPHVGGIERGMIVLIPCLSACVSNVVEEVGCWHKKGRGDDSFLVVGKPTHRQT